MIVLTGSGRSGTSALAGIYRELGFDPGGRWNEEARAGYEDEDVAGLNIRMARAAGMTLEMDHGPFTRFRRKPRPPRWPDPRRVPAVVDTFGDEMRSLAAGLGVVKDPKMFWTLPLWLAAGSPVDHVTITARAPSEVADSRQAADVYTYGPEDAADAVRYGFGLCMSAIVEYSVPWSLIRFPGWLSDPRTVYDACRWPEPVEFDRFLSAFEAVVDPGMVTRS